MDYSEFELMRVYHDVGEVLSYPVISPEKREIIKELLDKESKIIDQKGIYFYML